MSCKNCINRANKDKMCIYKHTKIVTVEDALLHCNGCPNYTPCGGLMKRSWGWNNGAKDKTMVSGRTLCESCGAAKVKKVSRPDLRDRKRLKCQRCGFTEFQ